LRRVARTALRAALAPPSASVALQVTRKVVAAAAAGPLCSPSAHRYTTHAHPVTTDGTQLSVSSHTHRNCTTSREGGLGGGPHLAPRSKRRRLFVACRVLTAGRLLRRGVVPHPQHRQVHLRRHMAPRAGGVSRRRTSYDPFLSLISVGGHCIDAHARDGHLSHKRGTESEGRREGEGPPLPFAPCRSKPHILEREPCVLESHRYSRGVAGPHRGTWTCFGMVEHRASAFEHDAGAVMPRRQLQLHVGRSLGSTTSPTAATASV
jgi:hypothetical protein